MVCGRHKEEKRRCDTKAASLFKPHFSIPHVIHIEVLHLSNPGDNIHPSEARTELRSLRAELEALGAVVEEDFHYGYYD